MPEIEIQTRHPLPLSTLQPYLAGVLRDTTFPPPTESAGAGEGSPGPRGWDGLRSVKQFSFGQSNPTYLLTDVRGSTLVLRSRPPGKLISPKAHNLYREYTILAHISAYNDLLAAETKSSELTKDEFDRWTIPVPRVYAYYKGDASTRSAITPAEPSGGETIGMPEFYLMEYVDGRVFEDAEMPDLPSDAERAECWHEAIRTLTLLSTLPLSLLNLPADFAPEPQKPLPFFPRQVRSLLAVSKAQSQVPIPEKMRKIGSSRTTTGKIAGEDEMIPYLSEGATRLGKEEAERGVWSLVAGDYKIDNLIFRKNAIGRWKVVAVLDWELCTVGSPLSDLANLLLPYSIDHRNVPEMFRPPSASIERLYKDKAASSQSGRSASSTKAEPLTSETSDPDRSPAAPNTTANLLKGFKNVTANTLSVPPVEILERYWVQCMNEGESWANRLERLASRKGRPLDPKLVKEVKLAWIWPISGMDWVRSWMLYRLAIIAQGISARAALGQASSAGATSDSIIFDLFGKLAGECRKLDLQNGGPVVAHVSAKL